MAHRERERMASCEANQVAVSHLLHLLHKSYLGSQRYKTMVHRAVNSLCAYPLPIQTEKEALSLDGVGSFLAKEIMGALQQTQKEPLNLGDSLDPLSIDPAPQELGLKYKPEQGRGPWAIMIALEDLGGEGSKEDILRCLQQNKVELDPSCALEGSKWSSSIRTLVKKGILFDQRTAVSSQFQFRLTAQGSAIASRLKSAISGPLNQHTSAVTLSIANPTESLPICTFDLTQESDERPSPASAPAPPPALLPAPVQCFDLSQQSDGSDQNNDDCLLISHTDIGFAQREECARDISNTIEICVSQSRETSNGLSERESRTEVTPLADEDELTSYSQPTTAQDRRQIKSRRVAARVSTKTQTFNSTLSSLSSSAPEKELCVSDWEVVILIDKREKDHSFFEAYFNEKGIRSEVCQLAVGDYLWVAKKKNATNSLDANPSLSFKESACDGYSSDSSVSSTRSLALALGTQRGKKRPLVVDPVYVLDCIVERKTVNDLASSIVDGRYEEQKFRLRSCGIANCVYLVEGASLNPQGVKSRGGKQTDSHGTSTINTNSIITALAATQVGGLVLGLGRSPPPPPDDESEDESEAISSSFHVVNTRGLDHTALHLLCLHRQVEKRFLSVFGHRNRSGLLTFDHFQSQSSRKQRVDEVGGLFVSQLRQIPGCSTSAAKAIANKFGTFFNLYTATTSMPSTAFIDTISELKKVSHNGSVSRIGPVLAKYIFHFLAEKRSFQRLTVSPSEIR